MAWLHSVLLGRHSGRLTPPSFGVMGTARWYYVVGHNKLTSIRRSLTGYLVLQGKPSATTKVSIYVNVYLT